MFGIGAPPNCGGRRFPHAPEELAFAAGAGADDQRELVGEDRGLDAGLEARAKAAPAIAKIGRSRSKPIARTI
jgi:hypothetical protein